MLQMVIIEPVKDSSLSFMYSEIMKIFIKLKVGGTKRGQSKKEQKSHL